LITIARKAGAMLRLAWDKTVGKLFKSSPENVLAYSHILRRWVTIEIPKGRTDLIKTELAKLEAPFHVKLRTVGNKMVPKKEVLSGIEERNEWIRKIEV
jgi:hypothetical protein